MASCWALFTNIPFWDGDIVDPLNSRSLVENWDEHTINSGKHDIFNRKLIFQPLFFGHYIQILKGFHIKQHYLGDYPEGGDPSVAEVVTSTWISSPAARFPGRFWQAVPAPMFQHVSTIFKLQMLGENAQQPNAIFGLPWRLSRCRYVQRLCLSDRVPWLEPPWHLSRGHERCVIHQGSQGGWWWGCPSQSIFRKVPGTWIMEVFLRWVCVCRVLVKDHSTESSAERLSVTGNLPLCPSQAVLTFGNDSDDAECPDLFPWAMSSVPSGTYEPWGSRGSKSICNWWGLTDLRYMKDLPYRVAWHPVLHHHLDDLDGLRESKVDASEVRVVLEVPGSWPNWSPPGWPPPGARLFQLVWSGGTPRCESRWMMLNDVEWAQSN